MFNIFVKKSGQTLAVDFDAYPEHVKQHIIEYGLKQKFNDVHSAEEDGVVAWGLVQNLQERLLQGILAKRIGSGDPVQAALKKILRKVAQATTGGKAADLAKLSCEELAGLIAKVNNKDAELIITFFTEKAEAQIAKEREENKALMEGLDEIE